MSELDRTTALHFRGELRQAREEAFRDAESFEGIIHIVEQMGSYTLGKIENLWKYLPPLNDVASKSALAVDIPTEYRECHLPFYDLYMIVKNARNDAMHSGAFARHLTTHAVELALILEDALDEEITDPQISDYMVRNPICVALWQPVSFVRQQMLVNSFSYLPVKEKGIWKLISDKEIAKYLRGISSAERKRRLVKPLGDYIQEQTIALPDATIYTGKTKIAEVIDNFNGEPILVMSKQSGSQELVGIVTAFDLL